MRARIGQCGFAGLCLLLTAVLACTNSPLADLSANDGRTDPFDLKKTPFGAIFTLPNWPDTTVEEYDEAFARLHSLGTVISYIWEWLEGDAGLVHATETAEESRRRGFDLLLQLGPQRLGDVTPPLGLGTVSFLDPVLQERFIKDAVKLAELQPKWLVLATEINFLHGTQPEEFDAFVEVYHRAYTRIKEVAPDVEVGVSYNYLAMLSTQRFEIIDQMGPQDFIGFTSYPDRLVDVGTFDSVESFPDDYYSGLRDLLSDRPVAITEMGWTTYDDPEMDLQATFISRLPELLRDLDPILVCWAMLYDGPAFDIRFLTEAEVDSVRTRFDIDPGLLFERLNEMALLTATGQAKPGYFSALAVFGGGIFEEGR